jgi:hypothetical protein
MTRMSVVLGLMLAACGGSGSTDYCSADDVGCEPVYDADLARCSSLQAQWQTLVAHASLACETDLDCLEVGAIGCDGCGESISGVCGGVPIGRAAALAIESMLHLFEEEFRSGGCAQEIVCDCAPTPVWCDQGICVAGSPNYCGSPVDAAPDADLTVPDASPL